MGVLIGFLIALLLVVPVMGKSTGDPISKILDKITGPTVRMKEAVGKFKNLEDVQSMVKKWKESLSVKTRGAIENLVDLNHVREPYSVRVIPYYWIETKKGLTFEQKQGFDAKVLLIFKDDKLVDVYLEGSQFKTTTTF